MIDLKTTTESIVRQIANIEKVRTGEQLPTENERLVAYAAKIGNHTSQDGAQERIELC